MALLGVKISWISRAMPKQRQNNRGSDRGMKNLGSPSRALRSYPQPLTLKTTEIHDGQAVLNGLVSLSRRRHLEDISQLVDLALASERVFY